jgi:hypothetical protein
VGMATLLKTNFTKSFSVALALDMAYPASLAR